MRMLWVFLIVFTGRVGVAQLQPIGSWRDHLPYNRAIAVVHTSEAVWTATPLSLFSYDPAENSVQRWSKVNGLSETGISAIAADSISGKIIIAYQNSIIDIISEGKVNRIDALQLSNITGDKTINHIYTSGSIAYLSTGLGIVVVDLEEFEIRDTYIIGSTGSKIAVTSALIHQGFLYASTDEGLKRATLSSTNLADFRAWQIIPGLPAGKKFNVIASGTSVLVRNADSIYISTSSTWNFLYSSTGIQNVEIANQRIAISESNRIVLINTQGAIERIIQHPNFTQRPKAINYYNNNYWIADSTAGLSRFDGTSFENIVPNSPADVGDGKVDILNNTIWVSAGGLNSNGSPLNKAGLFRFSNGSWKNFISQTHPSLNNFSDPLPVTIDPLNQSAWFGSIGGGLLNITNDEVISIFKENAGIQQSAVTPGSYRVTGLAIDDDRNLWIANDETSENLVVRKPDGTFRRFSIQPSSVRDILVDDYDQKWIILNNSGLAVFNHGQTIDNSADDRVKYYSSGTGTGNLPSVNVLSIAKDNNGFLWVGSDRGIGVIQCPQEAFGQQGCDAFLPVVQQENFTGFLFRDQAVESIAVDGANRKWVGTRNGVWLISEDGEKTIYRFSKNNSPLPDDDIQDIGIDHSTGEVFILTRKGIVSFRSTATEGATTNSNVLVFPNPVPPGYSGTIAIRGLVNNATVKITELDGRLVYQTRALGGQAIWNGKDYRGRQISSGIYLVLISDDSRQEKMATKIVFIGK